jgi:hypothetical protein
VSHVRQRRRVRVCALMRFFGCDFETVSGLGGPQAIECRRKFLFLMQFSALFVLGSVGTCICVASYMLRGGGGVAKDGQMKRSDAVLVTLFGRLFGCMQRQLRNEQLLIVRIPTALAAVRLLHFPVLI